MADSHREEIAKLETLYANNPEGRVFTHLAEAYRKAGELERSREILEDGLRRHSDYSSAHVVLGRVLADQGQPDGAAAAFRRVLELDRHNLVALRSLGEIATDTGRTDEALHYYRELLSLDPSDERLRSAVRGLEERREVEAAAPPPPVDVAPAATERAQEPPAVVEELPGSEPLNRGAEPFAPEAAAEETPPGEMAVEPIAGWHSHMPLSSDDVSENWEEDVGIEIEAMPGDLGALTDESPADEVEAEATPADAWAESAEWLAQPAPTDMMATGLDLGIAGEEEPRVELPVSDLDLSQPSGDPFTPFDVSDVTLDPAAEGPGMAPFDLSGSEAAEPTPFDLAGEPADVSPDAIFGTIHGTDGFDIDVGPALPEFGDVVDETAPASEPEPSFEPSFDAAPFEPSFEPSAEPSFDAAPFDGILAEPPEPEPAPAPERVDGELVTETMAELYFAQGFYGRAADVYRSLLRDRPADARLLDRLAEAETMTGWPGSAAPGRERSAAGEEQGEAWLEGVESAWTGGGGVAGGETTPYAWAEPRPDEVPAGPRVGDFFRSLLAWRPGSGADAVTFPLEGGTSAFAQDDDGAEAEAAGQGAIDAAGAETVTYLPDDALEEPVGDVEAPAPAPWDAPEPVRPPELPEAASMAGADEEGADDDEDLEMFRSWLQSLRK